MIRAFSLIVFVFTVTSVYAQTFRDIRANLTGVSESASNWIDYDDDGDLDVMVTGEFYLGNQHKISTKIYRNDRNNRFKEVYTPVSNVYRGDFDWADYDLDGDLDLFIIGQDPTGKNVARLYQNIRRSTQFKTIYTGIPGLVDGSVEWGDYDHDGDPDLLLTGTTTKGKISAIYRNDRNNRFKRVKTNFPGLSFGTGKFADFDLDGDLDVILSGTQENGEVLTALFRNDDSVFNKMDFGLIPLKLSDIAWGDYDNDGDLDFVMTGEDKNGRYETRLYNNYKNIYFNSVFPGFTDVRSGSVDWGDFDGDGDLDLLLTGESYNGPVSLIYRNDRMDHFTDIHAQLIGLYMSDGHFGDYDNDGDLDVILSGMSANFHFVSKIYRNDPIVKTKIKKENPNDIWDSKYYNYERAPRVYFYVYSSGYFDLNGDGHKEFIAFVSNIKKPTYQYELEQKFNSYIRRHYPQWPEIDQANIVQNGFVHYNDAVQSRKTIINEYQNKNFRVIKVELK